MTIRDVQDARYDRQTGDRHAGAPPAPRGGAPERPGRPARHGRPAPAGRHGPARWRWVLLQGLLVAGAVVVYFGTRGLTAGSRDVAVDHAHDLVALERRLGIHVDPGALAGAASSDLVSTLANWVYIWGHWPVIGVVLLWLALRHREQFRVLRDGMLVSGGIGLLIYATYPMAPPRLAGLGFVDTVAERSSAYRVLQPPAFVNQYAAMPSLHVGWDLLVGMAVAAAAGGAWLRWVGRLMPVLMVLAVVLTANHYVLDVVGGVALALTGHAVARLLARRRRSVSSLAAVAAVSPPRSVAAAPAVPAPAPLDAAPAPAAAGWPELPQPRVEERADAGRRRCGVGAPPP